MRAWRGRIRLSAVSTSLLTFGIGLLIVSAVGSQISVSGVQVGPGVSWWQRAVVAAAGILSIGWAVLASREPAAGLRADRGFLGVPPSVPARLVKRPDLIESIVRATIGGAQVVAVTGTGGSGKSTLAARACVDSGVRHRFPDGITWLDAGPRKDPVALLADLGRRLGLPQGEIGFTTIGQGRDALAALLRGKRVLIALDNLWDRKALDALVGLAPTCVVIFTTRLPNLSTIFNATRIEVDELTQGEALELLSRWTGQDVHALPDIAGTLCARLGNIALGVAMAGAMVASGRSMSSVLALIDEDLNLIQADLDPHYDHRTLFAAIEVGISDLPEASRTRYDQLAVFAGRGPFPADAALALWEPELSATEADELLTELSSRALLAAEGNGWYTAHDLQFDILKRRIGDHQLTAAHGLLLEGYRQRYPGGWHQSASDRYLASELAGHLYDAGRNSELHSLLIDADWIQARLMQGQMPDLLADYQFASDLLTIQILKALRLSASVLASNPGQVRGQLAGRLLGYPDRSVTTWAGDLARGHSSGPWLAPLSPSLTPTNTGLKQSLIGHAGPVWSVAVTPDGAIAVSGGNDGSVLVWDLAIGGQRARLAGHPSTVMSVAITPDAATAISGGGDGTILVWDLAAGTQRRRLAGHSKRIRCVVISPDGTAAVSVADDGSARLWDLTTGRQRGTLTGHTGAISSVAVTADAASAFTSSHDGSVRIWDLATRRQRAELDGSDGEILSVAVTADGSRVVGGGRDGLVRVWDTASCHQKSTLAGHRGWIRSVSVTPDGRTAVTGGADGMVRVWDLQTDRQRVALTGHASEVMAVAVTQNGADAVSGGADGVVRVWDLAASSIQAPIARPFSKVLSVAVTADGRTAVTGGEDHALQVWDLPTGQIRATLTGHTGKVLSVAVTADGRTAVTGGEDHALQVWDLPTGQIRATLTGHTGKVLSVAVTPDAGMAISGSSDRTVRVWDLATCHEQAMLTGHTSWVQSVSITNDEFTVVSGSDDGYIRVWDLASGQSHAFAAAHTGSASPAAVAPDGSIIVSGSRDGSIHVWDLASGQEQATLVGHSSPISWVAVAPDTPAIVSGDSNGTVRVWDPVGRVGLATWIGDTPIVMCAGLPGHPLKIAVGQQHGPPYLLELED